MFKTSRHVCRCLLMRSIVAFLIIVLSACSSTTVYLPETGKSLPLEPGHSYLVSFFDGKTERLRVASVSNTGFTDDSGRDYKYADIEQVREKNFSPLKTTGLVLTICLSIVMLGSFLVGKTIEEAFEGG
jgi:hypothetical protein